MPPAFEINGDVEAAEAILACVAERRGIRASVRPFASLQPEAWGEPSFKGTDLK
jgi:hypothetical protein